jgi:predicted nucleotidyltransferase
MNAQLSGILKVLQQEFPQLAQEYGLASLGVFGSYVRAEQRPDSDVDLLATFVEPPGLLKFVELENRLSDLLGVKADLVMKDALKRRRGRRILEEVVPI